MIGQMDQVYANAFITIIAAAGEDSQMGLPGVSRFPRSSPQHVNVADIAMLEVPTAIDDIDSSKWASRGWTYQEGFLSTRRLIFIPSQVVYLCNGSYQTESLHRLLSTDRTQDSSYGFNHLVPRFEPPPRILVVSDLLYHIEQYSKRELSYSSDSLNAFLGILNYHVQQVAAKSESSILHLPWGLIVEKPKLGDRIDLYGLFWRRKNPDLATRRPEFPSWAWSGWSGALSFDGQYSGITLQPKDGKEGRRGSELEWQMAVEDEQGRVLDIRDFTKDRLIGIQKGEEQSHQPRAALRRLMISCMVIPIRLQDLRPTDDQKKQTIELSFSDSTPSKLFTSDLSSGLQALLPIWRGIYLAIPRRDLELRVDQRLEQTDCFLGLILPREESITNIYRILLARQVEAELYERLGVLDVLSSSHELSVNTYFGQCQMVFLDSNTGGILDKATISPTEYDHPFSNTAERRTICLV